MKLFTIAILTVFFTCSLLMTQPAVAGEEVQNQGHAHQDKAIKENHRQAHKEAHQAKREERQSRRQSRRQTRQERRQERQASPENLPAVRSPASLESERNKKKRRRIRRHKREN